MVGPNSVDLKSSLVLTVTPNEPARCPDSCWGAAVSRHSRLRRPRWPSPQGAAPLYKDAAAPVAARVADLLARMTLEEKVGQMLARLGRQGRDDRRI